MLDKVKQGISNLLDEACINQTDGNEYISDEILRFSAMLALDTCHDSALREELVKYLDKN